MQNGVAMRARARTLRSSSSDEEITWQRDVVPATFEAAKSQMNNALYDSLVDSSGPGKKFSMQLLTPGLNEKLEQKVIMRSEYLYDLIASTFPVVSNKFCASLYMFKSMGDAAGFQKYCWQMGIPIPDNIVLTEIGTRYLELQDVQIDCCMFINARNHVGDPVLDVIYEICTNVSPQSQYLFLNCALEDKVSRWLKSKGPLLYTIIMLCWI